MHPFWRTPIAFMNHDKIWKCREIAHSLTQKTTKGDSDGKTICSVSTLLGKYLTVYLVLLQVAYEPTLSLMELISVLRGIWLGYLGHIPTHPCNENILPKQNDWTKHHYAMNSPLSICSTAVISPASPKLPCNTVSHVRTIRLLLLASRY